MSKEKKEMTCSPFEALDPNYVARLDEHGMREKMQEFLAHVGHESVFSKRVSLSVVKKWHKQYTKRQLLVYISELIGRMTFRISWHTIDCQNGQDAGKKARAENDRLENRLRLWRDIAVYSLAGFAIVSGLLIYVVWRAYA